MYLIGVILFISTLVALSIWDAAPLIFVDFPSLVVIVALTVPILLAAGLLPDFIKGFKLMGKKVNYYSTIDLRRILEATKLAVIVLFISGAIGSTIGIISVLANLANPELLGKSLAMALLTVLYSFILVLIILPVRAKTKSILLTME